MKKLHVGNLPYSVTGAKLGEMFSEFGQVLSASVIQDRNTGRSKGFGFVEMEDADALKAIDGLNNKEFEGRALKVSEARPMEKRENSGGFDRRPRY